MVGGAYLLSHIYFRKKTIEQVLEETFENAGLKAGKNLPLCIKKIKTRNGYKLIYHIPPGLAVSHFINKRDVIETSTKSGVRMWAQNGRLHIQLMMRNIPKRIEFEFEEIPRDMIVPIPVGWGRNGLEWLDLCAAPHLLVAGETFGGKSNLLHQALAGLVRLSHVQLLIIDLKRLEFSYLKKHAWYGYSLPEAVKMLEYLTKELHRRLEVLDNAGCVKIQDYKGNNMPYMVLVIDELSQLCPDGEPDKNIKKVKEYTHKMLNDLAALARAVGIHLVVSTQRPDHKILPGNLKANIPAKICYPVTSRVNSEIVLDNDTAFYLPRIKGRCIFKFDDQIEVQTMYLEAKTRARKLLKQVPPKPPVVSSNSKTL